MTRAFISIELPREIKKEILEIQKKIEQMEIIRGKFVEKENLHLTLKFLGEIDEKTIEEVKKKLSKLTFDDFDCVLGELGVFNENFIKIVWVSLEGPVLFKLQKKIDDLLEGIFPKEERFMAHITIARPKFVKDREGFIKKLKKINFTKKAFPIEKVFLKESKLSSKGPEYEILLEISSKKKYN